MPTLPATQLAYLRDQHPHAARVQWYLAVAPYGCREDTVPASYSYDTEATKTALLAMRSTGGPSRGDMDIDFTAGEFPTDCALDTAQGVLTYNPVANTFRDAGQDFRDWQAPADGGGTILGEALYVVVVTNDDGSICWGWLGLINGANTTVDVYADSDCSTAGWAGANPAAKTASSYAVLIAPNEGLTLWASDTAYNARDAGWVRVRRDCIAGTPVASMGPSVEGETGLAAPPWVRGTIHVAENDDIDWDNNQFLTLPGVGGFREIWGVYQRIVEAGGAVTFYKDFNVTYAAAGSPGDALPPKANAGPPVCAWIDPTTGVATVRFVGDDSYYTSDAGGWAGAQPHWWAFPGGNPAYSTTLGTCAAPVTMTWDAPGFYYVSLTVEDDNYQHARVYVPVWIFEDETAEPYRHVEVLSQECGVDGGWRARLKVTDTDEPLMYDFADGALVVLFTRTWFGDTETGVGGYCSESDEHYRDNIRFVGWIRGETLNFDYEAGTVEFEAVDHDGMMRRIPGFAFTLEDTAAPSEWYEMADLDVDRALHHLLEYHSTVNQVCHVEPPGEGAGRSIAVQPFPDAALYSQAQEHLLKDAQCLFLADRQGLVLGMQDPQFLDAADRDAIDVVCTLSDADADWMGDVEEDRAHFPSVGRVKLGGFHDETPLLAQAPGDAPLQTDNEDQIEGCILTGAAEARRWSGQALAKLNNPFPAVPVKLSGYWPVFDPAYQEYVRLTIAPPADVARQAWTSERFVVRDVSFRDEPADGTAVTEITVEKETQWLDGEDVEIPDPPAPENPAYPTLLMPAPFLPPDVLDKPDIVFVRVFDSAIYRTGDWTNAPPTWSDITGGLTNINRIVVDQVNRYVYVQCNGNIYRGSVDSAAPAWVSVFDYAVDLPTALCAEANDDGIAITTDGYLVLLGRAPDTCTNCANNQGDRPVLVVIDPSGSFDVVQMADGCVGDCCPDHGNSGRFFGTEHNRTNHPWTKYNPATDGATVLSPSSCHTALGGSRQHICSCTRGAGSYSLSNEGDQGSGGVSGYTVTSCVLWSTTVLARFADGKLYTYAIDSSAWTDITPVGWTDWTDDVYGLDRDAGEQYAVITDDDTLYESTGGQFTTLLDRGTLAGYGEFRHCSCWYGDADLLFLAVCTTNGAGHVLYTDDGGASWTEKEGAMGDKDYHEIRAVWSPAS